MKFPAKVLESQSGPLTALEVATLQVNIGYRCNLACRHCHVEGGPQRTEVMERGTVDAVLAALASSGIGTIDITGGAPELNPHFRRLVAEARALGKHVVVRTNLAVFSDDGMAGLPEFYRDHDVELVASLPYFKEDKVDRAAICDRFAACLCSIVAVFSKNYRNFGTIWPWLIPIVKFGASWVVPVRRGRGILSPRA